MRAAVEEKARRLARCERAVQELDTLRTDRRQREERLEKLRAELAALPAEYDRERHRQAEARLRELRELERRASRLEPVGGGAADSGSASSPRPRRGSSRSARGWPRRSGGASSWRSRRTRIAELAALSRACRGGAARGAELRVVESRGVLQARRAGARGRAARGGRVPDAARGAGRARGASCATTTSWTPRSASCAPSSTPSVRPELERDRERVPDRDHRRPLHLARDQREVQRARARRGRGEAGDQRRGGGHREPRPAARDQPDDRRARRPPALAC